MNVFGILDQLSYAAVTANSQMLLWQGLKTVGRTDGFHAFICGSLAA